MSWCPAYVDVKALAENVSDVLNVRHEEKRCLNVRDLSHALHRVGVDGIPGRRLWYVSLWNGSDCRSDRCHLRVMLRVDVIPRFGYISTSRSDFHTDGGPRSVPDSVDVQGSHYPWKRAIPIS